MPLNQSRKGLEDRSHGKRGQEDHQSQSMLALDPQDKELLAKCLSKNLPLEVFGNMVRLSKIKVIIDVVKPLVITDEQE